MNRPNLSPKRESLCNFGGCLHLVQKLANCSMTHGQDIALLGERAQGQNPPRLCPSGIVLPPNAAEVK